MFHSRFAWKLFAAFALLILLATALVGGLVARRVQTATLEEIEERLRAQAVLLGDLATNSSHSEAPGELQTRVLELGRQIGTRLTIIASDGIVLADSEEDPDAMDNHGSRPEVLAARTHGSATVTRLSRTLGQEMMYLAISLGTRAPPAGSDSRDDHAIAYVRTSLPLDTVDLRLAELRTIVLLSGALATLFALAVAFVLAGRIARPLRVVTAAAESIARGDYQHPVPRINSQDEVAQLADTVLTTSERLREQLDTITTDRNQLNAILASMVEGVIAVDRDERIVHINAVAAHLLHIEAAVPCEGRPIWEAIRLQEVATAVTETLGRGIDVEREVSVAGVDSERVLELRSSPQRNGEGDVTGAVLVLHDVTRLQRLERVRRDFVTNVSHELKTPLTAIRGIVETLIDDEDVDSSTRLRFLGKIRDQTLRLTTLVTDLLSLSRIESERDALSRATLDLRVPIMESLRALRPGFEAKNLTADCRLPDAPVVIFGEDEALRQAVTNLLDNAIKYSDPGSTVEVSLVEIEGEAILEVRDNGIGIEPQHHDRIFERFYRVDKARSRELGGTGLGLSIVKNVALAHGGAVSLESAPAAGSTFRITIPVRSNESLSSSAAPDTG